MKAIRFCILTFTLLSCAVLASAQLPPLPPMTNGDGNPANNGMKHIMLSFDGTDLTAHIDEPPASPVTMMSGHGFDFDAAFDVLEDRYFNSQHGWLQGFPIVPPQDSDVWIRRTGATMPDGATLGVFEGGMGMEMNAWTMNEIHTEAGDPWKWDRMMQHDLYVADLPGEYSMSFEVYLGDSTTGEPLTGYGSATTTLYFTTPVPEPAAAVLCIAAVAMGCWYRKFRG